MGLCSIPSGEGIEAVLKNVRPTKALGPDGLPPLFFQFGWNTIKDEVVDLFNNSSLEVLSIMSHLKR